MINEKAGAPTPACEEVKVGMNQKIIPQLLPSALTNDEVLFGLRLGNATWWIGTGKPLPPMPKGAK